MSMPLTLVSGMRLSYTQLVTFNDNACSGDPMFLIWWLT